MRRAGRSGTGKELPPPYRLPELVNAISERETVFFVEGEKDVESLMKIGITASTLAGGIGGWDSYDLKDYFNLS